VGYLYPATHSVILPITESLLKDLFDIEDDRPIITHVMKGLGS
jgi:hypothetical protein